MNWLHDIGILKKNDQIVSETRATDGTGSESPWGGAYWSGRADELVFKADLNKLELDEDICLELDYAVANDPLFSKIYSDFPWPTFH